MRIRNTHDCNYDQTVFGVRFKDGVSQGDFNQDQLNRLKAIGTFPFVVINDCLKCAEKEIEIQKLNDELTELKSKKAKTGK